MEVLRASEALLPFLAPSAHLVGRSQRSLSATTAALRHRSPPPYYQSSTHAQQASRSFSSSRIARAPSDSPSKNHSSTTDEISSLLDSALDFNKGTPTAPSQRTSRFSSPSAQQSNPPSRAARVDRRQPPDGSAVDELLQSISVKPKGSTNSPSQNPGSMTEDEISRQLNPNLFSGFGMTPPPSQTPAPISLDPPSIKLGPTVGRTVKIDLQRNMDATRAFRTLEINCNRNSVKRDFMKQRFHERPGLKRKRLKMERWRRRFKQQFSATVKMVQKMRKQGW